MDPFQPHTLHLDLSPMVRLDLSPMVRLDLSLMVRPGQPTSQASSGPPSGHEKSKHTEFASIHQASLAVKVLAAAHQGVAVARALAAVPPHVLLHSCDLDHTMGGATAMLACSCRAVATASGHRTASVH
jgi:hypothetical protein